MKTGFFAYSSKPISSGEAIEEAIKIINSTNREAKITSWRELSVNGKIIIDQIIKKIDESDFVCADLTGMNDNVLFEIGYSIGKNKPLFLILDTSISETVHRFKEFNLLSTVGYSSYFNTEEIIASFERERVFSHTENSLVNTINRLSSNFENSAFLYLKSQFPTNYSQEIINQSESYRLSPTIDDASENKIEPLEWYISNISSAPALLSEFSSIERAGYALQNSKCAFLSGIAIGMGKKLLMVCEKPYYEAPVDYRNLLKKYDTREECARAVRPFMKDVRNTLAQIFSQRQVIHRGKAIISELQNISFGESTAEHESDRVYEYYVPISHTDTIVRNEYNIIIGRKGTGKTATFYYLESQFEEDVRNFVCTIKPINFQIEGIVKLLNSLSEDFERSYIVEAVWKFLIYSELSLVIYNKLITKNQFARTDIEYNYINFIEENGEIFLNDFSSRLELVIESIYNQNLNGIKQNDFKLKVSEILHDGILYKLREFFADLLSKNQKLVILIDNLDKSWRKDSRIPTVSKFILGLLGVSGRLVNDLSVIKSRKKNLSVKMVLFLRSDIFKYIMREAREPDKIEVAQFRWEDPEVLFTIVEERFVQLSKDVNLKSDLWDKFICHNVDGIDTKDFIKYKVFPRPRDIIFFFNRAKEVGVSRGHNTIEAQDIKTAYKDYSDWIFKSVIVENGISFSQMSDFMYELSGENSIISQDDIELKMISADIDIDKVPVPYFIDHLISLSIIGREIRSNEFKFEYNMDEDEVYKKLASKLGTKRYKIHEALHPYLEIRS